MKVSNAIIYSLIAAGSSLLSYGQDVTGTAAIGYNSLYEFRGVDLGSNMVEASASLSTTYEGFGFTASAWYATVNDNPINTTPNELDLTFGITKSLGPINLSGGYIYYSFFNATQLNTQELYLGASSEIVAGITLGATAYYDIDLYNGWYFDANLSKTFKPCSCVGIVTAVGVDFAEDTKLQAKANGKALDGYQGFYAMISVPCALRKDVTLTPYVRYVNADSKLATDSVNRHNIRNKNCTGRW